MRYFIYQHTRLDTNEVFYIGKGTRQKKGNIYRRAYTKSSRNNYWLNIVQSTPYKVDIIEEFYKEKDCLLRETELIMKHGYSWNNTGTLCNMVKEDSEIKILAREGASSKNCKKVYQYSMDGVFIKEFSSVVQAKKECVGDIYNAMLLKSHTYSAGGYQWRDTKYESIPPYSKKASRVEHSKDVYQYDLQNNLIKIWKGTKEPSLELKIHRGAIRNCLSGIANTAGKFIWKYKTQLEKKKNARK